MGYGLTWAYGRYHGLRSEWSRAGYAGYLISIERFQFNEIKNSERNERPLFYYACTKFIRICMISLFVMSLV